MKRDYKKSKQKKQYNNFIYNHIMDNLKRYIIVTIFFFIGVIASIFFVKNMDDAQIQEMTEYVNKFVGILRQNQIIDAARGIKIINR